MRVLIVKTSSLGDIIHTLPAVEDARRLIPDLHCEWLAERPYARIPAWHPSVERVIGCDLRGWRRDLRHSLFGGDWKDFRADLRKQQYDLIIDAQGLVKSAWLASQARGVLVGPDRHSAREPLAAAFYARAYPVPAHNRAHAVTRMRQLFASALRYPVPQIAPSAGLNPAKFPRPNIDKPYAIFLHGTTWTSKRWSIENWQALGRALANNVEQPLQIVLPWGSQEERAIADVIASKCGGLVLPQLDLDDLAGWLARARVAVGMDTGLAHLAAAFGTPQVTMYGPTLPELTGTVGANQVWLKSSDATVIDRERPTTVSVERVVEAIGPLLARPELRFRFT